MKYPIVGLMLFLMTASVWAGTWSDGFEGGEEDWEKDWQFAFRRIPTTVKIEDGKLVMEVDPGPFFTYLRVIESRQWTDYTVSVRVRILEILGPVVDGGIMIRENDPTENMYYFFIADRWTPEDLAEVGIQNLGGIPVEGRGAFARPRINNQWRVTKSKVFVPELGQWYTLKAVARGNHVEFYVDDNFIAGWDSLADFGAELTSGGVGVLVANAIVHFDDFVVTGSEIPDGGPGGATSVDPKTKLATTWGQIKSTR